MNQIKLESKIMNISTKPEDIDSPEAILHFCDEYPSSGQNRAAAKLIRKLLSAAPLVAAIDNDHAFKNFHRNLCERFGYSHDDIDWKRDQASLIEFIAGQVAPQATFNSKDIVDLAQMLMEALPNASQGVIRETIIKWEDTLSNKRATVEPLTDEHTAFAMKVAAEYERDGQVHTSCSTTAIALRHEVLRLRALLVTPPTSKATDAHEQLFQDYKELLAEHKALEKRLATSKADTGEAIYGEDMKTWRSRFMAWRGRQASDQEIWNAAQVALKSSAPSTIKAEPTGEQL